MTSTSRSNASERFSFATTLADSDEERANPWLLLKEELPGGAVPVIADATSLQYVLHAAVGDTFSLDVGASQPLELRFVASLSDSVLQGEFIMSEENFLRLFPSQQGYRLFLIDAPGVSTPDVAAKLGGVLERELDTFGFDATVAAYRTLGELMGREIHAMSIEALTPEESAGR